MVEVRLRAAARADLKAIWIWGAERWGHRQADAYSLRLESGLLLLADNPGLGRASPAAEKVRQLSIESHIAFYRVEPSAVIVLRVLHGAMDPLRHLRET